MGFSAGQRITAQMLNAMIAVAETGNINTGTKTVTTDHATLIVPNPGVTYRLQWTGYVRMSMGTLTGVILGMRDGPGTGGTLLQATFSLLPGIHANATDRMYTVGGISGPLSPGADRTVTLVVTKTAGGGGDGWAMHADSKIHARVIPV
ncbi:hypothetical protein [Amycolatopsis suaedae]|uniref:Uncharacterized protein n=1 Tax=Amycolatopsis suaedae TaxID=2510978 RepID=A0A4Q7IZZ1_9PSEU|nr:hypothetical protein [Amycolatopsis suaedae]RZQ59842.1 hypothetical protein EWH70_32530 [Amycolatopsis suaedae]